MDGPVSVAFLPWLREMDVDWSARCIADGEGSGESLAYFSEAAAGLGSMGALEFSMASRRGWSDGNRRPFSCAVATS